MIGSCYLNVLSRATVNICHSSKHSSRIRGCCLTRFRSWPARLTQWHRTGRVRHSWAYISVSVHLSDTAAALLACPATVVDRPASVALCGGLPVSLSNLFSCSGPQPPSASDIVYPSRSSPVWTSHRVQTTSAGPPMTHFAFQAGCLKRFTNLTNVTRLTNHRASW